MHYEQAISILIQYNIVSWISQALQKVQLQENKKMLTYLFFQNANEEKIRAGVRLLALCTQANEQAQRAVANDNKRKVFDWKKNVTRCSFIDQFDECCPVKVLSLHFNQ